MVRRPGGFRGRGRGGRGRGRGRGRGGPRPPRPGPRTGVRPPRRDPNPKPRTKDQKREVVQPNKALGWYSQSHALAIDMLYDVYNVARKEEV